MARRTMNAAGVVRSGALCLLVAVSGACGTAAQSATEPIDAQSSSGPTTAATATGPPDATSLVDVVRPIVPRVPTVRPPDVSTLTQSGDRVAERLGDLATPAGGIEVVGATCADDGGELRAGSGSNGTDVFDIDVDGSGTYYDERHGGLTTLEVGADGSGRFYDESRNALVTISVEPDRSGEYYQRDGDDLVTVQVDGDGAGEYYAASADRLFTVSIAGDGSGRLFDETETTLLTVDAVGDGSGEYYRERPGEVVTVVVAADGSWEYRLSASSRRVTLTVAADGSGSYDEAGRDSIEFEFDASGHAADGRTIVVPRTPEFAVATDFPPLGTLGSLAPPCATVIRLDSRVLFDLNEAVLKPEAGPVLDEVVEVLAESGKPIDIVGHTDSIGSEESNLELSLERARAVEQALLDRGLDVEMHVDGRGESEPVAPNETPDGEDDPAGRAQNRRVEITIRE